MTATLGSLPWSLLVLLATAVALALGGLDPPGSDLPRWRRPLAILLLGVTACWAVYLPWRSGAHSGAATEAVAWWALVVPVFLLGSMATRSGAPSATARLTALQAVPATLLGFAPAFVGPPLGALVAGLLRAASPPFHPAGFAAADALSPGAFGLLLVAGMAVGGPLAAVGAASMHGTLAHALVWVLAISIAISGLASAADVQLFRRVAVWGSVQAGLAIVLALLPGRLDARSPTTLAFAHLGACAGALPALVFVLGRVVGFARVSDLAAHGGLLGSAVVRGQAVLASALLALLASVQAPISLIRAFVAPDPSFPRLALVLAFLGWLGVGLSLFLAAYRIVRGKRGAPAGTAPELGKLEGLAVALLFVAAVLAIIYPSAWIVPREILGRIWSPPFGAP